MADYPVTQGEWTFLGKRTAVHRNGSVIVHNECRYYRLEADVIEALERKERNRTFLAALRREDGK